MFRGADGAYSTVANGLAAGQEGVYATVGPIDVPADSVRAIVEFTMTNTPGAGATTSTPRIRRGATTADTAITASTAIGVTASVPTTISVGAIDVLTGQATVTYSGTMVTAGGNTVNNNALITVTFV